MFSSLNLELSFFNLTGNVLKCNASNKKRKIRIKLKKILIKQLIFFLVTFGIFLTEKKNSQKSG